MTPLEFIDTLDPSRKPAIVMLRDLILKHDKHVTESVSEMMGKEMLFYSCGGMMKYAVASPKSHMSFHSLVMYGHPTMRDKFIPLLPKAKFQKGCINFTRAEFMPSEVAEELIRDSARVPWPPKEYLDRLAKKK